MKSTNGVPVLDTVLPVSLVCGMFVCFLGCAGVRVRLRFCCVFVFWRSPPCPKFSLVYIEKVARLGELITFVFVSSCLPPLHFRCACVCVCRYIYIYIYIYTVEDTALF